MWCIKSTMPFTLQERKMELLPETISLLSCIFLCGPLSQKVDINTAALIFWDKPCLEISSEYLFSLEVVEEFRIEDHLRNGERILGHLGLLGLLSWRLMLPAQGIPTSGVKFIENFRIFEILQKHFRNFKLPSI